jgi:hypothetical protein
MPTYIVQIPEVHYKMVEIQADSPTEAALLVLHEDGGEIVNVEFSHQMKVDNVQVEDLETEETIEVVV